MRFTLKHNGARVRVAVGKQLSVNLQANPSTGFSWVRVGQEDSENLGSDKQLRIHSVYDTDKQRSGLLVGMGGTQQHITVTPLKEGTYTLQLAYQRPWEFPSRSHATFSLTIRAISVT